MINKQEVIDEIENAIPDFILNDYQRGKETGLTYALELVEELDEPEKVVVPRCVADMIIKRKKQGDSLVGTLVNLGAFGDAQRWIRKGDNGDTFAKAWLYGYEVEKEKLYTAKLKSTNEYLHYDKNYKKILHFRVPDDVVNQKEAYHFTEDDLIKYYAWENEAYDVKEVKR